MNGLPFPLRLSFKTFLSVLMIATGALAQNAPDAKILVIDTNRLVSASQLGKELRADLEARQEALAQEGARLEEALLKEEQELTAKRAELPADEFAKLADAFNEKAQSTRQTQAEEYAALEKENAEIALKIYSAAKPIFAEIMREAGALLLIDQSNVLISAGQVNITDLAIERIDQALRIE